MNTSTEFESLIVNKPKEAYFAVSNSHHIFGFITHVSSFKTEISIKLTSISKFGVTFRSACQTLTKFLHKNVTFEIYIEGKLFIHNAYLVLSHF